MTRYMLFAGLGILIYTGVAYAAAAVSGFSTAHVAFGLQFALFASLSILFTAVILFYAAAAVVGIALGGRSSIAYYYDRRAWRRPPA